MSGINLREPKPSDKRKQLEQRAIAIVNHMPQTQGQGLKSLSALLIPPPAAGYDVLPSLKAAGYDAAAFRAAGCDWATVITAGFSAVEAKAAGYDAAAVAPPPKVTQPPPPLLSSSSSHFSRPGPRHRPCVSV